MNCNPLILAILHSISETAAFAVLYGFSPIKLYIFGDLTCKLGIKQDFVVSAGIKYADRNNFSERIGIS